MLFEDLKNICSEKVHPITFSMLTIVFQPRENCLQIPIRIQLKKTTLKFLQGNSKIPSDFHTNSCNGCSLVF